MGLVLDEPEGNEGDVVFKVEGVTILADDKMKQEIADANGLTVDYIDDPYRGKGLAISFNKTAESSCGSGCSC